MRDTERTYAIRALVALRSEGWQMTAALDAEGDALRYEDAGVGETWPTAAVDWIEAAEHGRVILQHPTHGAGSVALLFQDGEPEEVIYDASARTTEALDAIDNALASVLPRDWAR
jgi:hypothetical protein